MSLAHCRSIPPKRGGWGRQRPDPKEGNQGASRVRPDPPLQVGLRATMGRAHDLRRGRTEIDTFPVLRPPNNAFFSRTIRSRAQLKGTPLLVNSFVFALFTTFIGGRSIRRRRIEVTLPTRYGASSSHPRMMTRRYFC